jgi:hypothetical protein
MWCCGTRPGRRPGRGRRGGMACLSGTATTTSSGPGPSSPSGAARWPRSTATASGGASWQLGGACPAAAGRLGGGGLGPAACGGRQPRTGPSTPSAGGCGCRVPLDVPRPFSPAATSRAAADLPPCTHTPLQAADLWPRLRRGGGAEGPGLCRLPRRGRGQSGRHLHPLRRPACRPRCCRRTWAAGPAASRHGPGLGTQEVRPGSPHRCSLCLPQLPGPRAGIRSRNCPPL